MTAIHTDSIDLTRSRTPAAASRAAGANRPFLLATVPVAAGVALALGSRYAWPGGSHGLDAPWLVALAGAACWLYPGFSLRLSLVPGLANLAAAAALFVLAVLARQGSGAGLVAILAGHAVWGLALAWLCRRDGDATPSIWTGWSAFAGVLSASLALG